MSRININGFDPLPDFVFSPDGQRLLTISNELYIWDVTTGKQLAFIPQQEDYTILQATFSSDGQRVTITEGSKDTGTFRSINDESSDKRQIISIEYSVVKHCPVFQSLQALIDYTHTIVSRQLTAEQRRKFFLPETESQLLLQEGEKLAQKGNLNAAIIKFRKALESDSNLNFNPETKARQIMTETLQNLLQEGKESAQKGDLNTAIEKFKQALAIDPRLNFDPAEKARQFLELSEKTTPHLFP